jgi:hypothetical protein
MNWSRKIGHQNKITRAQRKLGNVSEAAALTAHQQTQQVVNKASADKK